MSCAIVLPCLIKEPTVFTLVPFHKSALCDVIGSSRLQFNALDLFGTTYWILSSLTNNVQFNYRATELLYKLSGWKRDTSFYGNVVIVGKHFESVIPSKAKLVIKELQRLQLLESSEEEPTWEYSD